MRTSSYVFSLVALASVAALAAVAAPGSPPESGSRFTMTPTENGVIRLDAETGAMARCTGSNGQWSCEDMNDSQRALLSEIDKLKAENKSLREHVEHLERSLDVGQSEDYAPKPSPKITLPTEEDVDKAFDYLERMLKKVHERMERLQERHEMRSPGKAL